MAGKKICFTPVAGKNTSMADMVKGVKID